MTDNPFARFDGWHRERFLVSMLTMAMDEDPTLAELIWQEWTGMTPGQEIEIKREEHYAVQDSESGDVRERWADLVMCTDDAEIWIEAKLWTGFGDNQVEDLVQHAGSRDGKQTWVVLLVPQGTSANRDARKAYASPDGQPPVVPSIWQDVRAWIQRHEGNSSWAGHFLTLSEHSLGAVPGLEKALDTSTRLSYRPDVFRLLQAIAWRLGATVTSSSDSLKSWKTGRYPEKGESWDYAHCSINLRWPEPASGWLGLTQYTNGPEDNGWFIEGDTKRTGHGKAAVAFDPTKFMKGSLDLGALNQIVAALRKQLGIT